MKYMIVLVLGMLVLDSAATPATCPSGDVDQIRNCFELAFEEPYPGGNLPVDAFAHLNQSTFDLFCGRFGEFQRCAGGDLFRIPLMLRPCRVPSVEYGKTFVVAHDFFLQFSYLCSEEVFQFAKASLPCLTTYYYPSEADRLCAESAFATVKATVDEEGGGKILNRSTRCYALALQYHCTLGAMDYMCGPTGKELLEGVWKARAPLVAPCSLEDLPAL